jgi:hypothetical protein
MVKGPVREHQPGADQANIRTRSQAANQVVDRTFGDLCIGIQEQQVIGDRASHGHVAPDGEADIRLKGMQFDLAELVTHHLGRPISAAVIHDVNVHLREPWRMKPQRLQAVTKVLAAAIADDHHVQL